MIKKHSSSFLGYGKVAEFLIESDADVCIVGGHGTALAWAAHKGKHSSGFLKSFFAKKCPALVQCVYLFFEHFLRRFR